MRRNDLPRGIALVLISTMFLSSADAISKYLSNALPAIEIAWLRWCGFVLIVVPALLASRGGEVLRSYQPGLQGLRGLGMVGAAVLFITSLRFLPLAEATATVFIAPVFITALSIPFLGEHVGARRWAAALVGLTGVLIIVRPGTSAFQPAAILPILSALSWAGTVVLTRKIGGTDHAVITLAYSALVGFLALSLLLPFEWTMPSWQELVLGAFVGLSSTAGHWLVVLAYRYADASVLAPFFYAQLLWSSLLGFLLFAAIPDVWTFIGAGVIVASGLYTVLSERTPRPRVRPTAGEP